MHTEYDAKTKTRRIIEPTIEEATANAAYEAEQAAIDPVAARRILEIKARLDALDTESIRSVSAIVANKKNDDDVARLEAIETEKAALRVELAALS